jgi:hypothetical protein
MVIKEIKSKKNRVALYFGKANSPFGLFGGIQYYENFDWNHLDFGLTIIKWYVTLKFRWRVANCGYPKGEVYTD